MPDLLSLKANDPNEWRGAFTELWPIALKAAQNPKAGLTLEEAEDVGSEAILKLIGQIDTVKSWEHAKALLVIIASRTAVSLARQKSAQKRQIPEEYEQIPGESASIPAEGPSELDRAELLLLLRKALAILDSKARQLLLQKVFDGLTYQELGVRHGLPEGTVCTIVFQAVRKIRGHLQKTPNLLKELEQFLR